MNRFYNIKQTKIFNLLNECLTDLRRLKYDIKHDGLGHLIADNAMDNIMESMKAVSTFRSRDFK